MAGLTWIDKSFYDQVETSRRKKHSTKWFKGKAKYLGDDYILKSEYDGVRGYVTFFHKKCGQYWVTTAAHVIYGHSHCPCTLKNSGKKRIDAYCVENNLKRMNPYMGMRVPIYFKNLSCGHVFKRRPDNVIYSANGTRCPICARKHKRGEVHPFVKQMIVWRKDKGYSQQYLAYLLKVSTHTLSDLENGYKQPTKLMIDRFSYYMNLLEWSKK